MNSRTKRKLRVLADPENKLTEKGEARLAGLEEKKNGKLVRGNQKRYFDRLVNKGS